MAYNSVENPFSSELVLETFADLLRRCENCRNWVVEDVLNDLGVYFGEELKSYAPVFKGNS